MFNKNFILVGLVSTISSLIFWLGLIAGVLWLLRYFGVFGLFN